jgi:transposase-like protein
MNEYSEKIKSTMIAKMTAPGGVSASALSEEVGIPHQTLSRWRNEYAKFGGNGGGKMKSKRPEDWTAEEKLKALLEYDKLDEQQKGKYLREKGLHSVYLQRWQQDFVEAYASKKKKTRGGDPKQKRIKELEKELRRKDKALAETAALLVLKKKAQAIWGDPEDEK